MKTQYITGIVIIIIINVVFPSLPRLALESHDQPGETAVLRRAGSPQQAAPGKIPGLQVQAAAKTHLPGGWKEAAHRRVQGHHEVPQTGNETIFQRGVRGIFSCVLLRNNGSKHLIL